MNFFVTLFTLRGIIKFLQRWLYRDVLYGRLEARKSTLVICETEITDANRWINSPKYRLK